jgi:hypothetical protein
MSSEPITTGHPVLRFAHQLTTRLEQLASRPVWSMSQDEQRDALRELARAEAQLAALKLRVLGEAERSGAGQERAAASAADWAAIETRQTRVSARSDLKLAQALEGHLVLGAALDGGDVNVAQARVIITALDRLPTTGDFAVDPDQRQAAEAHLVAFAAHHDAKVLADLEAAAARRTTLVMSQDDAGTVHGRFRIPVLHGQWLKKMILALSSPVRSTSTDIDDTLPTDVRHGLALCQLIEAIPAKSLPKAGGTGATIVVTMTLDQLLADLHTTDLHTTGLHTAGVCDLDTGAQITAAQARRLACTAGIIPAVLGTKSQVLDLGRRSRGYREPQRIALGIRDKGCTAEGCEQPPAMCHAHHNTPWSRGGHTNLADGRLLCGHHHRRIHDPHYRATTHPNGKVTFHRRT